MGEGSGLQEKDTGYGRRIWATEEEYGLQEKDIGHGRRMWATEERC